MKDQYTEAADVSPPLSIVDKKFVQEVTGNFLYYSRVVNPTMLIALGSITAQQENPMEHTMQKVKQLLYYASPPLFHTHIQKSDMVIAGHSYASYLSETKYRSRSGGHFFMSNNTVFPPNN